ncbi:hypothetical protein VOLCADRAFT_88376 [Volvox carteri f. nagariensis]|uniref:Guanylate cyclase domain-containing protein n=1 Tax=Volvox carteri f. nagariensis TaxID=3068 RepID=D8TN71_VOLCA|nr:uncharacterized protein VOLCADRAFT_88376 [Volvox carteri f. nagariensis]EFJ51088.1 hypothetical protein VOLCADRAFT_88376 [Volvox carteri f. nagariensis]|eukprot:XP_002948100.1 hypothetical protein VOLCADRAFT_88376 [Volvox carteri f. nagariensis]
MLNHRAAVAGASLLLILSSLALLATSHPDSKMRINTPCARRLLDEDKPTNSSRKQQQPAPCCEQCGGDNEAFIACYQRCVEAAQCRPWTSDASLAIYDGACMFVREQCSGVAVKVAKTEPAAGPDEVEKPVQAEGGDKPKAVPGNRSQDPRQPSTEGPRSQQVHCFAVSENVCARDARRHAKVLGKLVGLLDDTSLGTSSDLRPVHTMLAATWPLALLAGLRVSGKSPATPAGRACRAAGCLHAAVTALVLFCIAFHGSRSRCFRNIQAALQWHGIALQALVTVLPIQQCIGIGSARDEAGELTVPRRSIPPPSCIHALLRIASSALALRLGCTAATVFKLPEPSSSAAAPSHPLHISGIQSPVETFPPSCEPHPFTPATVAAAGSRRVKDGGKGGDLDRSWALLGGLDARLLLAAGLGGVAAWLMDLALTASLVRLHRAIRQAGRHLNWRRAMRTSDEPEERGTPDEGPSDPSGASEGWMLASHRAGRSSEMPSRGAAVAGEVPEARGSETPESLTPPGDDPQPSVPSLTSPAAGLVLQLPYDLRLRPRGRRAADQVPVGQRPVSMTSAATAAEEYQASLHGQSENTQQRPVLPFTVLAIDPSKCHKDNLRPKSCPEESSASEPGPQTGAEQEAAPVQGAHSSAARRFAISQPPAATGQRYTIAGGSTAAASSRGGIVKPAPPDQPQQLRSSISAADTPESHHLQEQQQQRQKQKQRPAAACPLKTVQQMHTDAVALRQGPSAGSLTQEIAQIAARPPGLVAEPSAGLGPQQQLRLAGGAAEPGGDPTEVRAALTAAAADRPPPPPSAYMAGSSGVLPYSSGIPEQYAAAQGRPSVLYNSPMQHVTVMFKASAVRLDTPADVPYERMATSITAAAHTAVDTVMNEAGTSNTVARRQAGRRPTDRWLGYISQVQCLRGCLEVVLRLQYDGDELQEEELAAAVAALERELRGLAAVNGTSSGTAEGEGGDTSASGSATVPSQVTGPSSSSEGESSSQELKRPRGGAELPKTIFVLQPRTAGTHPPTAAQPSVTLAATEQSTAGAGNAAAIASEALPRGIGPDNSPASTTAAAGVAARYAVRAAQRRGASKGLLQVPFAPMVPLVAYMHPPVLAATVAASPFGALSCGRGSSYLSAAPSAGLALGGLGGSAGWPGHDETLCTAGASATGGGGGAGDDVDNGCEDRGAVLGSQQPLEVEGWSSAECSGYFPPGFRQDASGDGGGGARTSGGGTDIASNGTATDSNRSSDTGALSTSMVAGGNRGHGHHHRHQRGGQRGWCRGPALVTIPDVGATMSGLRESWNVPGVAAASTPTTALAESRLPPAIAGARHNQETSTAVHTSEMLPSQFTRPSSMLRQHRDLHAADDVSRVEQPASPVRWRRPPRRGRTFDAPSFTVRAANGQGVVGISDGRGGTCRPRGIPAVWDRRQLGRSASGGGGSSSSSGGNGSEPSSRQQDLSAAAAGSTAAAADRPDPQATPRDVSSGLEAVHVPAQPQGDTERQYPTTSALLLPGHPPRHLALRRRVSAPVELLDRASSGPNNAQTRVADMEPTTVAVEAPVAPAVGVKLSALAMKPTEPIRQHQTTEVEQQHEQEPRHQHVDERHPSSSHRHLRDSTHDHRQDPHNDYYHHHPRSDLPPASLAIPTPMVRSTPEAPLTLLAPPHQEAIRLQEVAPDAVVFEGVSAMAPPSTYPMLPPRFKSESSSSCRTRTAGGGTGVQVDLFFDLDDFGSTVTDPGGSRDGIPHRGDGSTGASGGSDSGGKGSDADRTAESSSTSECRSVPPSTTGDLPPSGGCPSTVDVRVVVKQHGVVVAEVERLSVGRSRGASVRLDLSGLEEGSAALLVLPIRQEPARQQQPTLREALAAAALYIPIAIVPPAVACELRGLMHEMYRAAATGYRRADPRVARARAFTHHFSLLVSDMVSLLLGCERLVEEEEDVEEATKGGAVAASASSLERHQDELRELGIGLISYMVQMGLTGTVRYLLEEVQDAGVQIEIGSLVGEEAVHHILGLSPDTVRAPTSQATQLQVQRTQSPSDAASLLSQQQAHELQQSAAPQYEDQAEEAPGHGRGGPGGKDERTAVSCGGTESSGFNASHSDLDGAPCAAVGLREVLLGFKQPHLERRFVAVLGGQSSWMERAVACILPAVFSLMLAAMASLAVWAAGFETTASRLLMAVIWLGNWGHNGTDGGSHVNRSSSSPESIQGEGVMRISSWGPDWMLAIVLLAGIGAALGLLALPAVISMVAATDMGGTIRQRRREVLVRIIHIATMVPLAGFMWKVPGPLPDRLLWAVCTAAVLLVLLQPICIHVRFLAYRLCWVADALALTAIGSRYFDASQGRDGDIGKFGQPMGVATAAFVVTATTTGLLVMSAGFAAWIDLAMRRRFQAVLRNQEVAANES